MIGMTCDPDSDAADIHVQRGKIETLQGKHGPSIVGITLKCKIYAPQPSQTMLVSMSPASTTHAAKISIPWFGARKFARTLAFELDAMRTERDTARGHLDRIAAMSRELVAEIKALRIDNEFAFDQLKRLGALSHVQLELNRRQIERDIALQSEQIELEKLQARKNLEDAQRRLEEARRGIVETAEMALLQEVGIYEYRHPLSDIGAYEAALDRLQDSIKLMAKKEAAILAASDWTVNGSITEGRAMIRDFSKLMLRAFNAEADNLVRGLKPYKLEGALDRLRKVAETIERL